MLNSYRWNFWEKDKIQVALPGSFFTLVFKDVAGEYMTCGTFRHNSVALQVIS